MRKHEPGFFLETKTMHPGECKEKMQSNFGLQSDWTEIPKKRRLKRSSFSKKEEKIGIDMKNDLLCYMK